MNWFHDSGLYDLKDAVSLPEILSNNLPQEAVRCPRINVLGQPMHEPEPNTGALPGFLSINQQGESV